MQKQITYNLTSQKIQLSTTTQIYSQVYAPRKMQMQWIMTATIIT